MGARVKYGRSGNPTLGWTGHVLWHHNLVIHEVMFSQVNKWHGQNHTLVTDMAKDVYNVCNFANNDKYLRLTVHQQWLQWYLYQFMVQEWQDGDLGRFNCPKYCKTYSSANLELDLQIILRFIVSFAFNALTLLVGRQEGHPACKKLSGGVLAWLSVWS